ncbi:hypothetical protein [Clostridium gasigenes]|uniref:hypothetical protein n=1 Tax=Clostridium gasigenes TaxID=94869 RepID=UPI001C0E0AD7|nr:hypothetical protein [Clostridium gasigenes]
MNIITLNLNYVKCFTEKNENVISQEEYNSNNLNRVNMDGIRKYYLKFHIYKTR